MRKSATLDRVVSGTMKLVAVLIGELYMLNKEINCFSPYLSLTIDIYMKKYSMLYSVYCTVKIIILVSLDTIPKYYVRSSLVIR